MADSNNHMVDSNHSISDLIEQPDDLSPIKITKTVSTISIIGEVYDGMPPIETVSDPSPPTVGHDVDASAEQLDVKVSKGPQVARVEQVESLQSLEDCAVEDVQEHEVPEDLVDASIDMVVQAFQSAGKKISEELVVAEEEQGDEEQGDYDAAIYSSSSTHLCAQLSQKILETSTASIATPVESIPLTTPTPANSAQDVDPSTTTLQTLFHKDSADHAPVVGDVVPCIDDVAAAEAAMRCYEEEVKPNNLGTPEILNVKSYQTDEGTKSVQFSTTNIEHGPVSPRPPPLDNRTPEEKKAERKALEEKTAAFGVKVHNNLNESLSILGKEFTDQGSSSKATDSIQNLGNQMLENDIKESKKTSQGSMNSSESYAARHNRPTEKELHEEIVRLEEACDESKQEISSYQRELERVRASGDDILELCNALSIDPAIATVQNLLHMMQKVRADMEETRAANTSLTEKLKEQTTLLAEQESLIEELDTKLKGQDEEDDHRVENKCDEIFEYYEVKLESIQEQLKKMGVELHSDFWVPHAHTLTARLKEIRSHKRTVAAESLLRSISNTETDKYDSNDNLDESPSRKLFTPSEKTLIKPSQIGNHSKYKVENDMPRNINAEKSARTCSIQ